MEFISEKQLQSCLLNNLPGENFNENIIFFEKLSISGLEEMHKYSINEKLYEYLEFEPFRSIEETREYIHKLESRMCQHQIYKPSMYWFVRRKFDKKLIGTVGLVNLNSVRKSIEWGYGIDPELWGEGYILQIQENIKHYVFEVLKLNRLEGVTMISNNRTISSLLATGMKNEGVLRQFYCKNGVFIDGWKYSMIKDDYLSFVQKSKNECKSKTNIQINDVIKILKEVLDENVNEDTDMFNSSSWDSINHMTIIVKLYEYFKVKLTPIQISNATSVKSIHILINNVSRAE